MKRILKSVLLSAAILPPLWFASRMNTKPPYELGNLMLVFGCIQVVTWILASFAFFKKS